jgi:hypothetical protein
MLEDDVVGVSLPISKPSSQAIAKSGYFPRHAGTVARVVPTFWQARGTTSQTFASAASVANARRA